MGDLAKDKLLLKHARHKGWVWFMQPPTLGQVPALSWHSHLCSLPAPPVLGPPPQLSQLLLSRKGCVHGMGGKGP